MSLSRRTTDSIFVVGLLSAIFWCGAQASRANTSIAGVSLAQYVAFCLGFAVQFALAVSARRQNVGRIITQMLWLFGSWTVCSSILILFVMMGTNYQWSVLDTTIAKLSVTGLVVIAICARISRRSLTDAAVKAWVNIVLKSIPQFLLAVKVWHEGPGGITAVAIVLGTVSIATRLIPMSGLLRKGGATRDEKWLWVTDVVNLASWLTVTAIWW